MYSNCRYRSLNSQTTTFRRRLQLSDEEKIKVRLHSNGHRLGHLRIEPPYRAAGRGLDFLLEPSVHGVREGCHEMDSMKWNGRSAAAKLKTAEKAEMLARWKATIGKPPRFATSRELVAMALAWHLQQSKYGGLKPLVERRLEALANAYRRGKLPAALLQACSFRPGTTLVKLWRGRRHTVSLCRTASATRARSIAASPPSPARLPVRTGMEPPSSDCAMPKVRQAPEIECD